MSKYTTELRYVLEQSCVDQGLKLEELGYDEIIENGMKTVFNFKYPIWLESERDQFQKDFCRHFYVREIGAETVNLWYIFLNDWLNTNMPYYNRLMNIQMADMDLNNFDYDEYFYGTVNNDNTVKQTDTNQRIIHNQYEDNQDSTNTGNSSSQNHNFQKYYEIPSNNINAISDHLNNATENDGNESSEIKNEGNVNGSGNSDNTNDYNGETQSQENKEQLTDNHIKRIGRQGITLAEIYQQYIDLAANTKAEIFNKMEILFMGIY